MMSLLYGLLLFTCVVNTLTENVMIMEKDMRADPLPYNPPPYYEAAKRARYMVHYNTWGVLSSVSALYNISGIPVPFTDVVAFSDGPIDNSTGIPYFYLTSIGTTAKDINKNDVVCLGLSEMETPYCKSQKYNPELPLCSRLTLCGHFKRVDSEELKFALNALFSRFPEMKDWPSSHNFFAAKLDIQLIWLIDYFGGAKIVNPSDYFNANHLV